VALEPHASVGQQGQTFLGKGRPGTSSGLRIGWHLVGLGAGLINQNRHLDGPVDITYAWCHCASAGSIGPRIQRDAKTMSTNTILAVLAITTLVTGIGGLILFSILRSKRVRAAWGEAARRLGLQYTPCSSTSYDQITGTLNGYYVDVRFCQDSVGEDSSTCTLFTVAHPEPLGLGLNITRQGYMAKFMKLVGEQDIVVGDPLFDKQVWIRGTNPPAVIRYLTKSRRNAIIQGLHRYSDLVVTDDKVSYMQKKVNTDVDDIVKTIKRLADVANRLADR
jgi:hypothetical protein